MTIEGGSCANFALVGQPKIDFDVSCDVCNVRSAAKLEVHDGGSGVRYHCCAR
jgi:hypothetical protein